MDSNVTPSDNLTTGRLPVAASRRIRLLSSLIGFPRRAFAEASIVLRGTPRTFAEAAILAFVSTDALRPVPASLIFASASSVWRFPFMPETRPGG